MRLVPNLIKYGSITLAVAGFFAIWSVRRTQAEQTPVVPTAPPVPPPDKPFPSAVAATGLLEALSENVSIGVPVPGLVQEVVVKVNDLVKSGAPLFRLDDRDLRAEQTALKARVEVARAQLAVDDAAVRKLESQLARWEAAGTRAVSVEEIENRRNDLAVFRARSGASQVEIVAAEAELGRLAQLVERQTVRSPRDGTVLQVNIRAGEYAATAPATPAMIIGDTDRLQVRADVDEQNATRIRPGQRAVAYLKGDRRVAMPLEFVRIEPYVIPKVSLTGASTERVDTRVLQVIFILTKPGEPPVYVGQQVDVFIEAPAS
jgi:multidrug efflux pump subunit AcrA (membrane-fusion protein)